MTISLAVVPIHHFSIDGWKYPLFRTKRRLEDIVMTSANREKLRHLVEDFGRSSKWYLDRGLCWQKGILLHGPPGCGKTSTIVALASEYDLRIFKLSLNHPLLTDNLLRKFIGNAHQKAIVYLEVSIVSALPETLQSSETSAAGRRRMGEGSQS
jgi:chaperone BCS1